MTVTVTRIRRMIVSNRGNSRRSMSVRSAWFSFDVDEPAEPMSISRQSEAYR